MKALFCTLLIFFSGCICTHDYYAPRVRAVPPPQPAYYYNSYDYYAYPPPIVFFDGGHHGHKEKTAVLAAHHLRASLSGKGSITR